MLCTFTWKCNFFFPQSCPLQLKSLRRIRDFLLAPSSETEKPVCKCFGFRCATWWLWTALLGGLVWPKHPYNLSCNKTTSGHEYFRRAFTLFIHAEIMQTFLHTSCNTYRGDIGGGGGSPQFSFNNTLLNFSCWSYLFSLIDYWCFVFFHVYHINIYRCERRVTAKHWTVGAYIPRFARPSLVRSGAGMLVADPTPRCSSRAVAASRSSCATVLSAIFSYYHVVTVIGHNARHKK
jgi:hypothetical protein